jgi:hypothetical protein
MKRLLAWLALLAGISSISAWAQDNPYCAPIKEFRQAPFTKDASGNPLRRAVEIHWIGDWLDLEKGWRIECRSGPTDAGKKLCAALSGQVNSEFTNHLPLDILACFGWSTPTPWNDLELRQVRLHLSTDAHGKELEDAANRYMLLETDMRPRKARHDAIRLSVVPWDESGHPRDPVFVVDDPKNPIVDDSHP